MHGVESKIEFQAIGGPQTRRSGVRIFPYDFEATLDVWLFEPLGLFGSKRLFRGQFGIVVELFCLICLYELLNLEALDLSRGRAGQIVLPDLVAADSLCSGDLWGKPFDVEADDFLGVDNLAFPEFVEVGNDHSM